MKLGHEHAYRLIIAQIRAEVDGPAEHIRPFLPKCLCQPEEPAADRADVARHAHAELTIQVRRRYEAAPSMLSRRRQRFLQVARGEEDVLDDGRLLLVEARRAAP